MNATPSHVAELTNLALALVNVLKSTNPKRQKPVPDRTVIYKLVRQGVPYLDIVAYPINGATVLTTLNTSSRLSNTIRSYMDKGVSVVNFGRDNIVATPIEYPVCVTKRKRREILGYSIMAVFNFNGAPIQLTVSPTGILHLSSIDRIYTNKALQLFPEAYNGE